MQNFSEKYSGGKVKHAKQQNYRQQNFSKSRHPSGLKGREIGMWYANRNKRRENSEKNKFTSVEMNSEQLSSAINAIQAVQSAPSSSHDTSFELECQNHSSCSKLRYALSTNQENSYDVNQVSVHKKEASINYKKMLEFRKKLPVYKMKEDILDIINSNQVVVISGETGSGKTTQIPQFILDDAICNGKKQTCKIVCTQPRRISAISVAERVAKERDEKCGEGYSCGYQIRLQSKLPRKYNSILYCTTGIIIQWLQSDAFLSTVSHIVLDEIHERDLQSDFLITAIKKIISVRKSLKVILMSATLNAEIFSDYFEKCPKLHIPGFTYPVTEYYLEEILEMTDYYPPQTVQDAVTKFSSNKKNRKAYYSKNQENQSKTQEKSSYLEEVQSYEECLRKSYSKELSHRICCMDIYLQMQFDFGLFVKTIKHIICNSPSTTECGAILVFLPGWEDIKQLNNLLSRDRFFDSGRYLIIPLHSMMPTASQQQVFDRPPKGVTKIVIATNIAETSITIDDVVYVIDCGKIKTKNFDHDKNLSMLQAQWVTKANAIQRKGRAGRVQNGYCYHMFSKLQESKLAEYIVPEILRAPLDQLCLQIRLLKFGKCQAFLSALLEAPSDEAVYLSVQKLISLQAFDHNENLTPLGYHLAQLPVEPQIGKMLIFGSIFSCLGPILTIAACLSFKDPFVVPLGKEKEVDNAKIELAKGVNSDHIMFVNTFKSWQEACKDGYSAEKDFCWEHYLSSSTLKMLKDMRLQFCNYLYQAGFIPSNNCNDTNVNIFSNDVKIVQAIVCSGLYPNIARLTKRLPHRPPLLCSNNERKLVIHPKSVNSDKVSSDFQHDWVCYYEKIRTSKIYLYDISEISPFSLLFFGGKIKMFTDDNQNDMISVDEWIKFKAKHNIAKTVEQLKHELNKILEHKIKQPYKDLWQKDNVQASVLHSITDLISRN